MRTDQSPETLISPRCPDHTQHHSNTPHLPYSTVPMNTSDGCNSPGLTCLATHHLYGPDLTSSRPASPASTYTTSTYQALPNLPDYTRPRHASLGITSPYLPQSTTDHPTRWHQASEHHSCLTRRHHCLPNQASPHLPKHRLPHPTPQDITCPRLSCHTSSTMEHQTSPETTQPCLSCHTFEHCAYLTLPHLPQLSPLPVFQNSGLLI